MRHISIRAFLPALLVMIATPPALAADVANKQWLACARLGTDPERLICYDRLAAMLRSEEPAPAGQRSAPALSGSDMFGLGATPPKPETSSRNELKSIAARITMFQDTRSGAIISLDNGQQWQQIGHEDLLLKGGQKVTISRGAFGSFWIMTEYNRSAHVKRLL